MTARTTVESQTGAIYGVSASLPATYDAAGYAALTYTTIGSVESCTPFGSNRPVSKFTPINGAVQNMLGTPDFGSIDLVAGDIPTDAGQIIMTAAEVSGAHHSVKVIYTDGEVFYFDVLVASAIHNGSKAGDAKTIAYKCPINMRPTRVAAA